MYKKRIEATLERMGGLGVEQMMVSDPQSIWYLTGVMVHPMERIYALYLNANGGHKLILNRLFVIGDTDLDKLWLSDTEDAIEALAGLVDGTKVLGVDKSWPARYVIPLMDCVEGLRCQVTSQAVDQVRAIKDEDELILMRKASQINDTVMMRAMEQVKTGLTEVQLAEYIKEQYLLEGCEGVSFPPIIAYGDNASDPHAVCGNRVAQPGDCVLIDIGCVYQGYCSDMTRTFFYQSAPESHQKIYDIVRQANERAIQMVRPGIPLCQIDGVARDYITQQGYGEQFMHRLGHFIGTECHEAGDVSSVNTNLTEVGNVFSIEPGIYLPGEVGVRIEDLVVVTETGCEVLNHAEKNLLYCGL